MTGGEAVRWLIRLIGLCLTMVVLAVAALALVPSDQIAALAARQLQAMTGREFQIGGPVRPSIWPEIGVTTGAVRIANADWSNEGPLLQATGLSIGLDLWAALQGRLKVRTLTLQGPQILLERNAAGQGNWQLGPAPDAYADGPTGSGDSATPAAPENFSLDHGQMTNGRVIWIDHATGQRLEATGVDADLKIPDFAGPAEFVLAATIGGQGLMLTAQVDNVSTGLGGAVTPVRLAVQAQGLKAAFDGQAGSRPLSLKGALDLRAEDPDALLVLLGQTPQGLPGPISITGEVTFAPKGSAHLRQGSLQLGQTRLDVAADLYLNGPRPKLVAEVTAGPLDLASLVGNRADASAPGASTAAPTTGWSEAPIDVSALALLDAEVTATAQSITLPGLHLGTSDIVLHLDAARAVFDLHEVQAYGGSVSGQYVLNGRKGLSTGGTLQFAGLEVAPLATDLTGSDRLTGNGDAQVKFLAVGNSMAALMRSLSGQGQVALRNGTIQGADLEALLSNLDRVRPGQIGQGARTLFDNLTGSFTIKDGVLANGDLALTQPLVSANGNGTVDIGGRRVDYAVAARLVAAGKAITVPLKIAGPWSDIRISLDTRSLIDSKLAEEEARLKAEATTILAAKLAAKLATEAARFGVVARAGESLEEALRRTAAEKAAATLAEKLAPDPSATVPAGETVSPSPKELLKGLLLKQLGK